MYTCSSNRFLLLVALILSTALPAMSNDDVGRQAGISSELLMAPSPGGRKLFTRIKPESSGLDFRIDVDAESQRRRLYEIAFAGAGVAIADFDDDGRPDIFMTHHSAEDRLYRQTGALVFTDVTAAAGLSGRTEWSAGAVFADINNDGHLDLYVCHYDAPNSLFINNGDGTFTDRASEYGLNYRGASVMAAFSDYDRDGDLDMYLLTSRLAANAHIEAGIVPTRIAGSGGRMQPAVPAEFHEYSDFIERPNGQFVQVAAGQRDLLFRNDGGRFSPAELPVSGRPGGPGGTDNYMGMSVVWWDFNGDDWPDIYVANDMFGPDRLYQNNRDGTFSDVTRTTVPHTPWYSMGADFADINNDGLFDLMVADMSATTHYEQKVGMGDMASQGWFLVSAEPRQYMRNALYLNSGTQRFMESAFLSGLASTDWSWSVKFADFDNDGLTDVFVSNGMVRNFMDSDIQRELAAASGVADYWEILKDKPVKADRNLAYRNVDGLRFDNRSQAWGLDHKGLSFGAALGDLDRDGDLDLVVNNLNEPVSLYRNDAQSGGRVLFRLQGRHSNRYGFDAKVQIEAGGQMQLRQLSPVRGFMSANEPLLHFGTGDAAVLDSVTIRWPGGGLQSFENLPAGRIYTVTEPADVAPDEQDVSPDGGAIYQQVTAESGLQYAHRELEFDDYRQQPLLPARMSQLGPGSAWGDADGDGDDDLFIGAAAGEAAAFYRNEGSGRFARVRGGPWERHQYREDMGVVWIDAEGDGDLDLYVASGSAEFDPDDGDLLDRLYLNDGAGGFEAAAGDALPENRIASGGVSAADFDGDGDLDLFVGGRVVPGSYPVAPRSQLLRNDGGRFVDVVEQIAPELRQIGMVTSGIWSDTDNDGDPDLLLTLEWGAVQYFRNDGGMLSNQSAEAGLAGRNGWWNSISSIDVNNDGRMDYVVTNNGLNSKYEASPENPATVYYGDFDGSGKQNLIEVEWEDDEVFPVRGLSCSSGAMPFLAEEFGTFDAFARADVQELFGPQRLQAAVRFTATELRSGVLINTGGAFEFRPLPLLAQIAPGFGTVAADFNLDGNQDIYLVQNSFAPQPETGRADGGVSLLMIGDGSGRFDPVWPRDSGLVVEGDAKSLTAADLNRDGLIDLLVTRNDDTAVAFRRNAPADSTDTFSLRLVGAAGNPAAIGARITAVRSDGSEQVAELHAGSGYLSQSAPLLFLANPASNRLIELRIRWPDGSLTAHVPTSTPQQTITAPQISPL